jgi:hypothetical protein
MMAVESARTGEAAAPSAPQAKPKLIVDRITQFTEEDLLALCEATDAAIIDGGGFGCR